jgi:subtilisin
LYSAPGRRIAPLAPPGGSSPHSWCLNALRVVAGYPLTGCGVKVAMLDTGIDLRHPDFATRALVGLCSRSFVPGESVQDGNGHGTHCAGIVGGPIGSRSGIRYGVAPRVQLLIGKVLSDEGLGTTDRILDGIAWAADEGARVICLSLGTARPAGARFSAAYERIAETLLRAKPGTLIVAAAGNSSARPFVTSPVENPAACPSVLAVGAVSENLRILDSCCGQTDAIGAIDLCGPGAAVHSAWTNRNFCKTSGSSAATPHVAGVAALHLEARPTLSAEALRGALEDTALPLGPREAFGSGLVRAPDVAPAPANGPATGHVRVKPSPRLCP